MLTQFAVDKDPVPLQAMTRHYLAGGKADIEILANLYLHTGDQRMLELGRVFKSDE